MTLLCRECQDIFAGFDLDNVSKRGDWDHDFASFQKAILAGCETCTLLSATIPQEDLQRWAKACQEHGAHGGGQAQFRIGYTRGVRSLQFYEKPTDRELAALLIRPVSSEPRTTLRADLKGGTDSEQTLQRALSWLQKCNSEHTTRCAWAQSTRAGFMPTRLIHIGDMRSGGTTRLVESSQLTETVNYVSLSHCWGKLAIHRLLSSNLDSLKEGIDLDILPKTFVQAMFVTQKIGIDYIWIDSLCIIQDSVGDWERESAAMGDVYRYSSCNIAATGFHDGSQGMFVARDPMPVGPILITEQDPSDVGEPNSLEVSPLMRNPFGEPCHCYDHGTHYDKVLDQPLNKRSWFFQERLLSPRTIHFGTKQIFWECLCMDACEVYPDKLADQLTVMERLLGDGWTYKRARHPEFGLSHKADKSDNDIVQAWTNLIGDYTRTNLTKWSDRLPALSGLAKEHQKLLKCRYLAGLWEKELRHQMLWKDLSRYAEGSPVRLEAPSWSWASTSAQIYYPVKFWRPARHMTEVVSVTVNPLADEMGEVKSGIVSLTGTMLLGTSVSGGQVDPVGQGLSTMVSVKEANGEFRLKLTCSRVGEPLAGTPVGLLPMLTYDGILHISGLILAPAQVEGQQGEEQSYWRRLDAFDVYSSDDGFAELLDLITTKDRNLVQII